MDITSSVICQAGFFLFNQTHCDPCPPGSYLNVPSAAEFCLPCPLGLVAPFNGTTECTACEISFVAEDGVRCIKKETLNDSNALFINFILLCLLMIVLMFQSIYKFKEGKREKELTTQFLLSEMKREAGQVDTSSRAWDDVQEIDPSGSTLQEDEIDLEIEETDKKTGDHYL